MYKCEMRNRVLIKYIRESVSLCSLIMIMQGHDCVADCGVLEDISSRLCFFFIAAMEAFKIVIRFRRQGDGMSLRQSDHGQALCCDKSRLSVRLPVCYASDEATFSACQHRRTAAPSTALFRLSCHEGTPGNPA